MIERYLDGFVDRLSGFLLVSIRSAAAPIQHIKIGWYGAHERPGHTWRSDRRRKPLRSATCTQELRAREPQPHDARSLKLNHRCGAGLLSVDPRNDYMQHYRGEGCDYRDCV
jgi:hypothetical protein